MCEPVSIVAGTAAVASAAYGAYSSFQQSKAAAESGDRNAKLAEMAAGDALARGGLEASRVRSTAARMASRQRASMLAQGIAGAGVDDVVQGTIALGGVDAETARNNGAREAWGFKNQADTSRFEGEAAAYRASQDAYGSILSGVAAGASAAAGGMQRKAALAKGTSALSTTGTNAEPAFTLKPSTSVKIDYTRFG